MKPNLEELRADPEKRKWFGSLIAAYRRAKNGWTQEYCADRVGMSTLQWSRMELGKSLTRSPKRFEAILGLFPEHFH